MPHLSPCAAPAFVSVVLALAGLSATCAPGSAATSLPAIPGRSHAPAPGGSASAVQNILDLPRIPWEGGPDYYRQFPGSSGYADPNVFPIAAWWATFDSDANVKWDRDHGVNTYIQFNPTTPGRFVHANGSFYVNDGPMLGSANDDPAWAGWWLGDEVDGRMDAARGHAEIQRVIDAQDGPARFAYANYTGFVTSDYGPVNNASATRYINMVPGAVSVDGYYYTDASCDDPDHIDFQINAPERAFCRTSAAYGNLIDNLRTRDAADRRLQPLWGFVENGAPGTNGRYIAPDQMIGAVWSMIRHEARGIVWFNQSFSGACQSGNVLRDAQAEPTGCNADRVAAMKTVDHQVWSLAPVLNTQSYVWSFRAPGAETMLKVKDGYAYVFAGVSLNQQPGRRTFTLPAGVGGVRLEVLGENRTLPVVGRTFTDTFAHEYTNHIYKIALTGPRCSRPTSHAVRHCPR